MNAVEEARARLDAADFRQARELAMEGLAAQPSDPELLRIAGLAGVELAADDAVDLLRRTAELRPDAAYAWHELGEALATEGRMEEAGEAFRKALELDPDDEVALTHLGHVSHQAGDRDAAVAYLSQAAERESGYSTAAVSLVDLYKIMGQHDEALAAARKVADASPEDVGAALDVAELSLVVGDLESATAAFERVREIDDLSDHEVYALHGLVHVEVAREDWGRALELAKEAVAVDPLGRTADLVRFLEERAGVPATPAEGQEEEPVPTHDEVEAALRASRAEHRRLHGGDRALEGVEGLG